MSTHPAAEQADVAASMLRGQLGAFALHARHDSRQITASARTAFLEGFERQVDPEGVLPESERKRRATYARKAYFARLALESARARQARAQQHARREEDAA